ncbi:hypothetical protein [Amycolatopsis sp. FDAARGOS 1241]|uniref:hypothetical protein n=1 Tax=Amycolatopsis sp. FDAARGOS 1241 TaxID=2778070 RepID=UPI001EF1BCD6|nr:hypothetical protein [Amycolatopsis sp. FDAARGOS 1241]
MADKEPKLIADTFSSAMSYGLAQSGPPIRTRGGVSGCGTGAIDGTRYSCLLSYTSRSVPNGSSASVPFARW